MPNRSRLYSAAVLVVLSSCASGAASKQDLAKVRRQSDSMRHEMSRAQTTIRALENRVFLLEDKLDTAQVALSRKGDVQPKLPVFKASPRPKPEKPMASTYTPPEPLYQDGDVEVVYEGAAAKSNRKRRKLEIDGTDYLAPKPRKKVFGRRPPRRRTTGGGLRYDADGYPIVDTVTDTISVGSRRRRADPISLYKSAYLALKSRQHETAIKGFRKFLAKWPNHDYADNSQYWLAEAYYDQRHYETALIEFRRVVQRFPMGNKAPDALLKIGHCYAKLADVGHARDVWLQVVEIYPKTTSAKLAAARLAELSR